VWKRGCVDAPTNSGVKGDSEATLERRKERKRSLFMKIKNTTRKEKGPVSKEKRGEWTMEKDYTSPRGGGVSGKKNEGGESMAKEGGPDPERP